MNAAPDPNWEPDPQWLAAYFDGELEGRDDLAGMRTRVEAWLQTHPEALEQCAELRQLQKHWLDTTPMEPTAAAWQQCLAGIEAQRAAGLGSASPRRRRRFAVGAIAASILLCAVTLFGVWRFGEGEPPPVVVVPKHKDLPEVFEVAQAHEITILRVEGADTDSLVVGVPPLVGLLELAESGDVDVLKMCPDVRDQMLPNVREQGRPLIWARIDTDE
jgi:hypothetical protein